MTDVTDAKAICLRHFAGVDNETLVVKAIIKVVEIKIIRGVKERCDDVALQILRHVFSEAHRPHARHAGVVIGSIPRGPGGNAAFVGQLAQGLGEGEQGVGGRREAKLAITLQAAPLGGEVEADGARHAFGGFEQLAFAQSEAEAGDTLHAFVGARDKAVELAAGEVKFDATEGTH